MKIDIDSIFYIILSIIILVVGGLSSRRRKQAQQMNKPLPASAQPDAREPEDINVPEPRRPMDAFERLEQILTGQSRYESMEGESLEVLEDEEQMIVDEEEEYLAAPVPRLEGKHSNLTAETEDEQGEKNLKGLFGDVDEITRAIIYSEILPRKYF